MITIPHIIEQLVKRGISVTIGHSDEYGLYFDLNTGAKSHLHLVLSENPEMIGTAYMRYDDVRDIRTMEDLYWEVKGCMCGRSFIDNKWLRLLDEEGIIRIKETILREII